jgi:hypothetical protein
LRFICIAKRNERHAVTDINPQSPGKITAEHSFILLFREYGAPIYLNKFFKALIFYNGWVQAPDLGRGRSIGRSRETNTIYFERGNTDIL